MSLQTSFWTIKPAGNGILYSGYPAGNPPTPTWTAVPNYLNQTQSFIVDIPLTFVTPSSASVTLHGSLPTGWTWTGTDLEYNGTSVNASPTTGLYFTATYLGQSVNSNTFSVQGQGSSSSDTIAPTIPTGLVATANSVSGGITIGGFTPADPNPVGQTATGLGQINVLRNSGSLGTATIPSPGAPGNLTTLTLTDIGGPFSPASTMTYSGADIVVTTVARDPSYPTTDGQALPYQQISGTSWIAWCEVSTFSPANAYDNVNIQARPTLTDNAAYVGVGTHSFAGGVGVFSEARASTGASLSNIQTVASSASPVWLYLIRSADTYSMYYSLNGNTLLSLGSTTQVMGSTVYVGFPVNTNDGVSITVTIQQCTIQTLGNWSYTDTTVTPGTTYTYSASSQDTIPNVSAASPTISVTAAASSSGIKWHPGHYALGSANYGAIQGPPGYISFSSVQPDIDTALNNSVIKGYMVIFTWDALEDVQGVYNLTLLDQIRNYIATTYPGKRFGLMIWAYNYFHVNPTGFVPSYILGSATYGAGPAGGYGYGYWTGEGVACGSADWRSAVNSRWEALWAYIANHTWSGSANTSNWTYNADPYVESIATNETGPPLDSSVPDFNLTTYMSLYAARIASMQASWPNTNVVSQNNWLPFGGQSQGTALTNTLAGQAAACGGPDIFTPQSSWTWGQLSYTGVASGSTDWFGVVPYQACVEYPDYPAQSGSSLASIYSNATGMPPSGIGSSHIWWETGGIDFTGTLVPYLASNPIPSANQTYPSAYPS